MESQVPRVVREAEAARIMGVSVGSLRRWRREGRGPNFVRIERCVGYRISDLESFLGEHLCTTANAEPSRPQRRSQ